MFSLFKFKRNNPRQVFAWATYDFANSAFATTILAVIFNKYYAGVVANGQEGVVLFGINVPGTTMFAAFIAVAMLLTAIISPVLAAIADLNGIKKRMLALHLFAGLSTTGLLYFVNRGDWLLGGVLFVIAQLGFAGGNIFYNALMYDISDPEDFGKVSGLGWAWGYIGGGLLLAINLVMLQFPTVIGFPKDYFTVQDCFLSVTVWWGLFSIPIFYAIRETPRNSAGKISASIQVAIKSLNGTIASLRRLPQFTRFFFAYLLYNDGIETVIVMASIFGDQELHMTNAELITFFLMIQGIAFLGSLFFGWLADIYGSKKTVMLSLFVWSGVVLWAWQLGLFGNPKIEYWFLGVLAAVVMGGSQAASRSLQAALIPQNRSAEFFSFFAISGKFASAVGPLIFGSAVFLTGSLRLGILALLVFFVAGIILLSSINEKEGSLQAEAFEIK